MAQIMLDHRLVLILVEDAPAFFCELFMSLFDPVVIVNNPSDFTIIMKIDPTWNVKDVVSLNVNVKMHTLQ